MKSIRKIKLKKVIMLMLAVFIIQFAAVELLLLKNSTTGFEKETDFLIILGAGLNGETPSLALYERLLTGLEYLKKYPGTHVVVSGGQGRGETITEAEAMERFLTANGIDQSRILSETNSTSTMENFKFSKRLIEEITSHPVREISFVTSSFHILRAKMLAGRNGLKAYAISSKTPGQVVVQLYIREYFALIKSLLVDR